MTTSDILRLSFAAGIAYAVFRQLRKDVDGIGRKQRAMDAKQQRRWLHQIANAIENAGSLEEAKNIAVLLREDAWKD